MICSDARNAATALKNRINAEVAVDKYLCKDFCGDAAAEFNGEFVNHSGNMNFGVILFPSVVIKAVHESDEAYRFYEQVRNKTLRSRFYPHVYAYIRCSHGIALVIRERLLSTREARMIADCVNFPVSDAPKHLQKVVKAAHKIRLKGDFHWLDCHKGNIMAREDGTPVLFDPVA